MEGKDGRFYFKKQKLPEGKAVTQEEAEQSLLEQIEESEGEAKKKALWQLSRVYSAAGKQDEALGCSYQLLKMTDDPEENAWGFFRLGQVMEMKGDYEAAIEHYLTALSLKPRSRMVCYFVNNNIGFSLNMLGRHDEAEGYLRAAIEVNPNRPNGHKNLGLCFQGRGKYARAAECFVTATKVDASDPRSFKHLEDLVREKPELLLDVPGLRGWIDRCRNAVEVARKSQPDFKKYWRKLRKRQVAEETDD